MDRGRYLALVDDHRPCYVAAVDSHMQRAGKAAVRELVSTDCSKLVQVSGTEVSGTVVAVATGQAYL